VTIETLPEGGFATSAPIVIVGAGAAGFCAALSAHRAGAEVMILERDSTPRGSTALSAGLIPAAGTRWQRALGIDDSAALFAADIQRKAHGEADAAIVDLVAREAAPTIEWLADHHGFPFSLVHDFNYPGHSAWRMHGLPSRSGGELIDRLRQAADEVDIPLILNATVGVLYADADHAVHGVEVVRPDGTRDALGCEALILACNGYGGAPALVARHIPEMRGATYFGHPGNRGDAVLWGEQLGAKLMHMSGYQGHGSVAHPHGVLITWAVVMEGGFQVNARGLRIAAVARQFADFQQAEASGAVIEASTMELLAERMRLPLSALAQSFAEVDAAKSSGKADRFGRSFVGTMPLAPPFRAVKVTGALFHTQGGLAVDGSARVLGAGGDRLPNLFAAGGAAAGVSGSRASGYLSGNGLLTATVLGRVAGQQAAGFVTKHVS
jgi:fumarate reductase flavoprotein subunit